MALNLIRRTNLGMPLSICVLMLVALPIPARSQDDTVPVSAEVNHKIRLDNGRVRVYEVKLAKGSATAFHEHTVDNFAVILNTTTRANEPKGGERTISPVKAGQVGFSSTAKGPYTHRVEATGDEPYRNITIEILLVGNIGGAVKNPRRPDPFVPATQDSPRGIAYRLTLKPGATTQVFQRPANTLVVAVSGGRISELLEGKERRLWDLDKGSFRWVDEATRLAIRNEGNADIELVEIEVFLNP